MNLLIDELPRVVKVCGEYHALRTDFRIWVQFELLMDDREIPDADKLPLALNLCFIIMPMPEDWNAAIEKMLWFYRCGKEQNAGGKTGRGRAAAVYSYEHDDGYIYAAFLNQYGVDLQEEDLHWWKFKAMFRALKADNEFVKIMGYRAAEIDGKMSDHQKKHLRNMKALYAFPLPKTEQQKISAIELALMGNGDLSGVV